MFKSFYGSKLWEHGASTVTFHMDDIQVGLVIGSHCDSFQFASEDDDFRG